ncbi:MAG TPA: glycosyltransferase family 2 protein [Gaiellaceae bacterium]|nr:glycosyltransferase family 2 protein [Gaiellaceae bacterium]
MNRHRSHPPSALFARTALAGLGALTWGWAALVALLDRRHRLDLRDVEPDREGPPVSVVVPARDEERGIEAAVRSLLAQAYRPLELLVVDDGSGDRTAELAERLGARVLPGGPLPPGWVGKSWACHQGAAASSGAWLLFTDADVVHAPDAVGRAIALAQREGRGGLTLLCRLDADGFWERVVQPAAVVLIRSFVAPGVLLRSPRSRVAIAAGGFILVERRLYERAGGHGGIRGRLVDDQALAEAVKAAGGLLVPAFAGDLVRVRMYEGLRELWRGWRKNASAGLAHGSAWPALALATAGAAATVAPAVALVRGPRLLGAAAVVGQAVARADVAAVVPAPLRTWPAFPLGVLFLCAVSLRSTLDRLRGGVEWRGRRYG